MQAILEVQYNGRFCKLYAESELYVVVANTPREKLELRNLRQCLAMNNHERTYVIVDLPDFGWPYQNTMPIELPHPVAS